MARIRNFRSTLNSIESLIFSDKSLKVAIGVIFFARLCYVLFVIDPHSGQDAPSFNEDARKILDDGAFTELKYAPQWPVGYSWFVAFWWNMFGVDSRMLGVAQTTLLLVAQIFAIKLVRHLVDKRSSQIFGYLILFNFALFSSSGQIMYEVPFASFLIIGAYNLKELMMHSSWDYKKAALSGCSFGLAVLIHPSALAPAAALLLVAFWKIKLNRRLILQALLALTILLSGVFVQVARNSLAGDGTGFTVTAFSNAQLGMWGTNNPIESEKCSQIGRLTTNLNKGGMRWDSPVRQLCLYKVTIAEPSLLGEIFVFNSKRYWSPFVGILKGGGTWYHGLDWRRLVSPYGYKWWEGNTRLIDQTIGYGWMFGHLGLFLIGVINIGRRMQGPIISTRKTTMFLAIPIFATYITSLLTLGDTRHRMPSMIFYEIFVAIGFMVFSSTILRFKSEREKTLRT